MEEVERKRQWQEFLQRIKELEARVRLAPQDAGLKFELAKAYYLSAKNEEALALLTELAVHDDPRVHHYLGKVHMKVGDLNRAITDFYKAMSGVVSTEIRLDIAHQLVICLEHEGWQEEADRLKRRLGF